MIPLSPIVEEIDITVVITCYNEEDFITDTIDNVIAAMRRVRVTYEIYVIDDASKDGSVPKLRKFLSDHPDYPVTLKVNEINRGLGNNFVEAAFLGRGKYYRLCNGDNCESLEVLVNIFKRIGAADLVIPYQNQEDITGKSQGRKLLSRIFTALVNLIGGYNIRYYNGHSIYLRYLVLRWHPSSYGFGFQADMITRLLDEGASYIQFLSSSVDRKGPRSSALSNRNILSVGHTLLEITIRRFRRALYGRTMPRPVEIAPKD